MARRALAALLAVALAGVLSKGTYVLAAQVRLADGRTATLRTKFRIV